MYDAYATAVEKEIAAWLEDATGHLGGFFHMMRYQMGLADDTSPTVPVRERTRPYSFLCFLTCAAVSGSGQDAIRAAAGIQLLTNFFQAHIDIEAQAPNVDGRPASWTLWGAAQSINLGDGMFSLASRVMLESVNDPKRSLAIFREFTDVSLHQTRGQFMALTFDGRTDVALDEYVEMVELKMGALAGYSAWTGALIGGSTDDVQQALRSFGSDLGVAHAIVNDVSRPFLSEPASQSEAGKASTVQGIEEHAHQRLDRALATLERAALPPSGHRSLEELAREMVLR